MTKKRRSVSKTSERRNLALSAGAVIICLFCRSASGDPPAVQPSSNDCHHATVVHAAGRLIPTGLSVIFWDTVQQDVGSIVDIGAATSEQITIKNPGFYLILATIISPAVFASGETIEADLYHGQPPFDAADLSVSDVWTAGSANAVGDSDIMEVDFLSAGDWVNYVITNNASSSWTTPTDINKLVRLSVQQLTGCS